MANIWLRQGFLDSDRMNQLSPEAECLFVRMLLVADGAGRLTGNAQRLSLKCWPLNPRKVEDVTAWLSECKKAGLISDWEYEDLSVVQIMRWCRQRHDLTSQFPDRTGKYKIVWIAVRNGNKVTEMPDTSIPPHGVHIHIPDGADPGYKIIAQSHVLSLPWDHWSLLKRVHQPDCSASEFVSVAEEAVKIAREQEGPIENPFGLLQSIFKRRSETQTQKQIPVNVPSSSGS